VGTNEQESIDEHVATKTKGDSPRDFIDVYLEEMEKQLENNSTFSSKLFCLLNNYMFLIKIVSFHLKKSNS
jgi:hypothetical protein